MSSHLTDPGTHGSDTAFAGLTAIVLDDLLESRPTLATELGDHRYDDRLDDLRPEALADERRRLDGHLAVLGAVDPDGLEPADRVDLEILRNGLEKRAYQLDVLREHEWDPLVANPGTALYVLLAREFAPVADRLRSLRSRLAAVPEQLEVARRTLGPMPRVHVETAIGQFTGTRSLVATELERALEQEPSMRAEVEPARDAAAAAVDEHIDWLRSRLAEEGRSARDPRIGAERLRGKLGHALDTVSDPDQILARAEADLELAEERIGEVASRISGRPASAPGLVRDVLDQIAADGHVDDDTIIGLCTDAMAAATEFVREQGLVTVYDDPVEVIVMPEIHRGVAVAYCDPPGPLEREPLPTFFAVAPTPSEWTEQRVASFYREYNAHLVHNLTVHEAMPGHVLQLAHSSRYSGGTLIRTALWSGSFVEGWAVYAEELMAGSGYRADVGPLENDALRMQQLKMQLRMIINTILDVRVHAHGMREDEAMRLMVDRGHQEEGEAAGKWRRALLTSAQLSTYFVGFTEVSDLARDLRAQHPDWPQRRLHDAMLAHGSPAPRHLRTLLAL